MVERVPQRTRSATTGGRVLEKRILDTHKKHLTVEAAKHVLEFFYQPGGAPYLPFVNYLLHAIGTADYTNKYRLNRGFPAYVAAYMIATEYRDGYAVLQQFIATQKSGGDPKP